MLTRAPAEGRRSDFSALTSIWCAILSAPSSGDPRAQRGRGGSTNGGSSSREYLGALHKGNSPDLGLRRNLLGGLHSLEEHT